MSFLNTGMSTVFGAAFSGIYLDATFRQDSLASDGEGGWVVTTGTPETCKAHRPTLSAKTRADLGMSTEEVMIIVLVSTLGVTPSQEDRITYEGQLYDVLDVMQDGAHSQWKLRCKERNEG